METILLNDASAKLGFTLLPKSVTDKIDVITQPAKGNQADWVGLAKQLNLPDTFDINTFRKQEFLRIVHCPMYIYTMEQ